MLLDERVHGIGGMESVLWQGWSNSISSSTAADTITYSSSWQAQ